MNKKLTIFTLVTLTIISILSILLVVFIFRDIEKKNKNTSSFLASIEQKSVSKEEINFLAQKNAEATTAEKIINDLFVNKANIVTFVNYLEILGTDSNIEVTVKNVNVVEKDKNKISVSLLVRGKYEDIMKLLKLLDNAPYYIHITKVFLNKEESQPIATTTLNTKDAKVITVESPMWQGEISFITLSY